jgi:nuclear RNA export factor
MDNDFFWISVNKDDVPDLLRLSGYSYAGAPITISETDEKMPDVSSTTLELKAKLTEVLARRYNPEQRLLDLSALGTDETLRSMDVFSQGSRAEKAFRALLRIATDQYPKTEEKNEAFQAVSIASNEINDVGQVFQLAIDLPRLKRLDLSGNNLDTMSKLSKWRHRFKNLEELHVTGNPVAAQSDFVSEMLRWFPTLQNLNGQQVRTPQEVAEFQKAHEPTPIPSLPSNLRDGENGVAPAFLQAFFPMYDTDRDRLVSEFYDDDSWFSLSVMPGSGRALPWKSYMKFSRNVQKIGSRSASTQQRLFTGGSLIADLWKALPPTRHPGMDQSHQWLVDCHTFPHLADPSGQGFAMGLIIIVQGQFEEADLSQNLFGTRTFSRTFILGPSKPNNPPPQHPYRVISDELTLHNWTPSPTSTPVPATTMTPQQSVAPIAIPTVAPAVVPAQPAQLAEPDDALKAQLIQAISQTTGMTAEYSELCLRGPANWNYELALQSFEQQKANLPPSAFIAAA